MKNEVEDYSIDDLQKDKRTLWTGVRNYQARNFMRDQMKDGDLAFFYHSNAEPSGAAGLMKIRGDSQPDPSQFDKKSPYYDEKATPENPRWFLREVEFVEKLPRLVSIQEMRGIKDCAGMLCLQKGSRLSITPVQKKEWDAILRASNKPLK
jgi:predicted RNA-binding protein with PUA-like domain